MHVWTGGGSASGSPADSFWADVTSPPLRCYFLFLPWKVSQLVLTWIPPPAPDSPALIECLRDNLHFSSPPGAPSEAAADVSYTA